MQLPLLCNVPQQPAPGSRPGRQASELSKRQQPFSSRFLSLPGILRICLREGLVPPGDAADRVVLGVKFENEMLWSKSSYKPHYVDESGRSEAQKWIRNLCARFDKASISKCLGMKPDKIQEVLDMKLACTCPHPAHRSQP